MIEGNRPAPSPRAPWPLTIEGTIALLIMFAALVIAVMDRL